MFKFGKYVVNVFVFRIFVGFICLARVHIILKVNIVNSNNLIRIFKTYKDYPVGSFLVE